ncbi:MAG: type 4b pilus protein PilO2 [Gammaproteobacteria bacterium]
MEILELGGRSYAIGLYWWRAVSEADQRHPRRAARRLAREIGRMAEVGASLHDYNLIAVYPAVGLIGLGESSRPVRATALVPALAAARPDAGVLWHLRIRPDRLIVMATLKGQVIGDGDYVGDEAGANARRAMLIEHYGSQLEERVEEGSVEQSCALLERLLDSVSVPDLPVTQPLKMPQLRLWLAGAGLAVFALVGGMWWHESWQVERLARIRARLTAKSRAAPLHPGLKKMLRALGPKAILRGCEGSWQRLPLSEQGWMLARFSCNGRTASVLWRYRPGASFVHLPDAAGLLGEPGSGAPDEALATEVVRPHAHTRIVTRDLCSRMRTEGLFYRFARREGIGSVEFSWQSVTGPNPVAADAQSGPVRPWAQAVWRLEARGVNPFSLGQSLEALPGIEVRKVVATIAGHRLRWVVEGVIYARS